MSKEIYISSTPHETRLAIVENDALAEIYYERENEYTLAGSIYNGRVTRVLPGMQSSFVDIGLERDAFLYITDFMEEAGDSADFETTGNGEIVTAAAATATVIRIVATATATSPLSRPRSLHRLRGRPTHRARAIVADAAVADAIAIAAATATVCPAPTVPPIRRPEFTAAPTAA